MLVPLYTHLLQGDAIAFIVYVRSLKRAIRFTCQYGSLGTANDFLSLLLCRLTNYEHLLSIVKGHFDMTKQSLIKQAGQLKCRVTYQRLLTTFFPSELPIDSY